MSRRLRRLMVWGGFMVFMGGVALVAMFPYDLLQARTLAFISARSGWNLTAEHWSLAWPPGIRWQEVVMTLPEGQALHADVLQLSLSADPYLKAVPGVEALLVLHGTPGHPGGTVRARLTLDGWSEHASAHLTGTLLDADATHWGFPHVTGGLMQGSLDHAWSDASSPAAFLKGEGTWRLSVSELTLDIIRVGSLTFPGLAVSSLKARLHCKDGGCPIEELNGEGPDGSLTGEGLFAPRLPVETSTLAMWLSLTPSDGLSARLDPSFAQILRRGTAFKVMVNGPLAQLRATL